MRQLTVIAFRYRLSYKRSMIVRYRLSFRYRLSYKGINGLFRLRKLRCTVLREISGRLDVSVYALLLCNSTPSTLGIRRICPYQRPSVPWKVVSTCASNFPSYSRKTSFVDLPLLLWRAVHAKYKKKLLKKIC